MASQSQSSLAAQICSEIAAIFTKPTSPHAPPLDLLVTSIAAAASQNAKIFLYGVGREGLMLKALCMRLAHLGLNAHQVFDMNAPPISAHDLLIASAGPGGFSTVDAICSVARSNGGKVLLLTARLDGSAVKCADVICFVPARTMADGEDSAAGLGFGDLVLPMGSLYEGALFVLFEMVVFRLREVLGESAEAVRSRHTNLE